MNTVYAPKNKIIPHIIKDFFSKEDLDQILSILENQKVDESLDSFYKPMILPDMSRMQIEVMYPEHIKKKIEKFASELVGEEVFMNHNSYLSYNLNHGDDVNPKLPPHYDSDNYYSKLTIDYQLDTNIDWVLTIEDKKFNLEYGDLLVFWGAGQAHWREPILFKEGDNTEVLTMHFSTMEDYNELNIASRDADARKKRIASWSNDPIYKKYTDDYEKKNAFVLQQKKAYEKIKKHSKKIG
jgi:hypothetical protein